MEEKKPAGLAIASMVLGIISFVIGGCLGLIGLPVIIVGIVLGIIALKKVSEGVGGGKGMAIAGLILNGLSLIPVIIGIVLGGAFMTELMAEMDMAATTILPTLLLK